MVGTTKGRVIPDFFTEQIKTPINTFESPNMAYNPKKLKTNVFKTLLQSFSELPKYVKSLLKINAFVKASKPDVIINFYEVMGGLYGGFFRPKVPIIAIAHQYLLLHKDFIAPKHDPLSLFFLNLNTSVTAWGSTKKLALSFRNLPSETHRQSFITPPLLRSEALTINQLPQSDAILAYVTYPALAEEIKVWHKANPAIKIDCFWDEKTSPQVFQASPNLTFYRLDATLFLEKMKTCTALVTTAGFESVCEAMYWGKPVLMMPAHIEQACNALDAQRAGAGIAARHFDLDRLMDYLPVYQDIIPTFRTWSEQAEATFLTELTNIKLSSKRPKRINLRVNWPRFSNPSLGRLARI